jgi:DNA-binding transcriptional regulator GbsR (MarR family)
LHRIIGTRGREVVEAATHFIERLGLQVEGEGFPRISGRIVGFLLLQDRPYSLDELADELKVSKASISTNARALERLGYVERHSVPGDRRDYYQIVDEPWVQLMATVRDQFRSRIDLFTETESALPVEFDAGRRRLAAWRDFFTHVVIRLDTQVEGWCEERSELTPAGGGPSGHDDSEEK